MKEKLNPPCPCGGQTEYFGEALMGSLTCDKCGDQLIVVGWDLLKNIRKLWLEGKRGYNDGKK